MGHQLRQSRSTSHTLLFSGGALTAVRPAGRLEKQHQPNSQLGDEYDSSGDEAEIQPHLNHLHLDGFERNG